MSAVDQLKFERELANKREYTPEEAKKNIAETLLGLAYSTPGIANSMSIRDAFEARDAAAKTDDPQEKKRLNAQAVTSVLSAFLPFSLGSPSAGSASRFGVFAGPAAKTADHAALARAKDMLKAGASRDEIIDATGWFKQHGQWKFEIDDSAAKVNLSPEMHGTRVRADRVGQALEHPDLYGAYPELEGMLLKQSRPPRTGAYVTGDKPSGIPDEINIGGYSPSVDRRVMLHEIQHAIDEIEDFPRGGNSMFAFDPSGKGGAWDLYRERYKAITTPKSIDDYTRDAGFDSVEQARDSYNDYVKGVKKMQREGLPPHLERIVQEESAKEYYKRLAGETQARNVETRLDYSPDLRQSVKPWATQEFPDEKQFIKGRHREPQETFVPADEAKAKIARQLYEDLPRSFTRPDLANRETMRRTGVLFGSEGAPKEVVSDKTMRIMNALQSGETRPLGSIVEHPELFSRVEGLADTPVEVLPAIKAASGEGFHRPIARTTEGGTFQVSENARPKWLKEQMAKLMQYEIGRRAGFAPAARHGIAENIARIDQTIDAVSKAMESGATPRKTGMSYINKLMKARNRIAVAQEAASTDPASSPWLREMGHKYPLPENEARRAISRALNSRMAGNVDAEIAMRGVHGTEASYPYKGRSMGEMIALPPQIDDMEKLVEFLANWRTYGQGAPQSVMRRMPEHLR